MTHQLIISAIIVTYILIIKGVKADIFVNFQPPLPQVNSSLCIFLNLTDLNINETYNEINLKFKPPTYDETLIFSYSNKTFHLNETVLNKYFQDRWSKDINETNFCLSNVLKEDLTYPFRWKCDHNETLFRLRDPTEDQAPNIYAIFFHPVIPMFGKPICYSLNYTIGDYTLLDNVVLSAKYYKESEWEEIFRLSEENLQYNETSRFYSKLDTSVTKINYFCFTNVTLADNLIDFQWKVFDLNFNNTGKKFNSDDNGKLNGKTRIKDVEITPKYPRENETFCIHLDYNLNYNGSTNSLPVFILKINGEVFLQLNNNSFEYNSHFTNNLFSELVDKRKTTLTYLCLVKAVDTDASIEFRWLLQDWKNTRESKIFYLPGFSSNNNFSVTEKYNNSFDIGSQHLCLSVEFDLPYQSELIQISLFSQRPQFQKEKVLDYFVFDNEARYKQTDNIDPESRRSNGFCFTEVTPDVIHKVYTWRIVKSNPLDLTTKEFSLKSDNWQIEKPEIFQIEMIPSVLQSNQELCLYLKYKIDTHASIQHLKFGTVSLYDINYQEITNTYEEIFHLAEDRIVYNPTHPLVFFDQVEFEKSDYDQICFHNVNDGFESFNSFKWFINDSYNQEAEMTFTIPNTTSGDLKHNITAIGYEPSMAEANKPLCISVNYTGDLNTTSLHFQASDPGTVFTKTIYSYFYEFGNLTFCNDEVSDICDRINQNISRKNKICFNSLTLADSYRTYAWIIEDAYGYFSYIFSFDVFNFPTGKPTLTLQSQTHEYQADDHVSAKCSFENLTVNPKLSWYINNDIYTGADVYYYHSNYNSSNPNWYVNAESSLKLEITSKMVKEKKNIILRCECEIGHKSAVNGMQYKKYESNKLIPIKGSLNNNDTQINSVTFEPPVYERNHPLCLTMNYSTSSKVFSVSLLQGHGDSSKVIYEYENGKVSFPDNVNLTNRIDLKNTNKTKFCLLNVERNDEQEYIWVVNDLARNQVKKPFKMMTYEKPQKFDVQIFNVKQVYISNDLVEGHCLITDVRPQPVIQLQLDETPFPSNWSITITSPKEDSYDSVAIFAFKITPEMTKKNMSKISCQYLINNIVKDVIALNVNFQAGGDTPKKGLSGGAIAGAIIGAIVLVLVIAFIGYYFYKKRYQDGEHQALL